MKKIKKALLFVIFALVAVSCQDEQISRTLEGIWEGEVRTEFFSYRGKGVAYQRVDIKFYEDPYRYTSGRGVEYDYYDTYRGYAYDVVDFRYEVRNGIIYLDYADDTHVQIRNYRLNNDIFDGDFHDDITGQWLASFHFVKVVDWYHSRYYTRSGNSCELGKTYKFDDKEQ